MHDLSLFINSSESLRELTGRVFKPCVVILGSFNSGKSTLLNSLLGMKISPVGIIPTTSCMMYFDYGSSFRASVYNFHKKAVFQHPAGLHSFLARENVSGCRVEIEVPSPILHKCRLVDTPGIDSLDRDSLKISEQAAKKADKILYLFHQRGIEESSQLFLYKLASIWKNKNLNDISFWLNCNLGTSDGTSLETTRSALREVFLSPVKLNTINTFVQENIETLYLFLEVELAREYFRQAAGELKKIDLDIPQRLKKIAAIKDEVLFLTEFWGMQETTRTILEAGRILHTIPLFVKELENRLELINSANLRGAEKKAGGMAYRPKTPTIKENRKALLNILSLLINDAMIKDYIDRHSLEKMSSVIESERFTVVAAGGFSTGKSTFINALLKEDILPAADGPTTAAITRITHGRAKKAIIYTPLQTTLQVYDHVGDKAVLNRGVLEALERWITADGSGISLLEASVDRSFEDIDTRKAIDHIKRIRALFAAGSFARTAGNTALPSIYRSVPGKTLKESRIPQKIRVTFKNTGAWEYDLSEPAEVKTFWDAMGPEHAFRIREVEIQHPSEFLEMAVMVDTPGLDWIQRHHNEKTSYSIRNSDACLVFLNGKHILSDIDRNNFQSLFWLKDTDYAGQKESLKDEEKIFYVISFADTLTPPQREAVYNYVMRFLIKSRFHGPGGKTKPKIFLISGLKGLTGSESGISSLLKSLEEVILRYRGRSFYLTKLNDIYSILESASQKINSEILCGQTHFYKKKILRAAQQSLKNYKSDIKSIRNTIFSSGRF